jgi:hypothetical protein
VKNYFWSVFSVIFSIGGLYNFNIEADKTTETDEKAMANPAISGRKLRISSGTQVIENSAPAAIGMATILYIKAQKRFCLTFQIVFLAS